jgi:AraC family ethanolamine operon transcriptional activator
MLVSKNRHSLSPHKNTLTMLLNFTNFEVYSEVLKAYDLDVCQIDRGQFNGSLQQIQYGSIFINSVASTRRFEIFGSAPPGLRTFGITGKNCLPFIWRNKLSDGSSIQIYKPSTELEMITQPFFEAIDFSITEEAFNTLLQQWQLPELDKLIARREMVISKPDIMQLLRKTLKTICTTVNHNPELLRHNTALQDLIKIEMPKLLSQALMQGESQDIKTMPIKRSHALKTAVDYIRATPHKNISLNTFCIENNINDRTLQRAFLEHYGVTGKSYATAHRLNHVFKTLSASDPKITHISDIAANHGFWHMSQFATDYRRHFGELPSETLKAR